MSQFDPKKLQQTWPQPLRPKPIVIIGAGGIVRDAHLPAYQKANFPVAGIFDVNRKTAEARAEEFHLPRVFKSIEEAVSVSDTVFDLATPPKVCADILKQLPDGAAVLIQKPMGDNLAMAQKIAEICRRKKLKAAVNFQLRFAPFMLAIRDFIRRGELGEIVDVEVRLNLQTPWEIFPFLQEEPRVEILFHSVHYLDLIRQFLGNPRRVFARSVKHPKFPKLAGVRSSIVLDYDDMIRCCLSLNHCHSFGAKHSAATIRFEGAEGCAIATLGLLLDYPKGRAEKLEIIGRSIKNWTEIPLRGKWFPDAFAGAMSNLQRFAGDEDSFLISSADDALETMRLVEACYISDESGGTKFDEVEHNSF